jgi:hypothetical protein
MSSPPPTTIQLYKLICRQVATNLGLTASPFCPSPWSASTAAACTPTFRYQQGRQEPFGIRRVTRSSASFGWEFIDRISDPGQRHLLAAQRQRQRVSPPRPALRSAQPDQGFGGRSRVDGAHSYRQRAQYARGGTLGRPRRQPLPGPLLGLSNRPRGSQSRDEKPTCAKPIAIFRTTFTTRWPTTKHPSWTTTLLGADVKGSLRRPQAGQRRPLPASLRHLREGSGGAVPPRSLQPVSLESVLDVVSSQI